MSPSMQDLRTAMEAANAGAAHPADRMELIRRRVRRTRRVQLAAGAAATALALCTAFFLVPGSGDKTAPAAAAMTGSPAPDYPEKLQSLPLLKAVKYDSFGKKARLTITPTGPVTLISASCDRAAMLFFERNNIPSSATCRKSAPGPGQELYIETKAGVPLTLDLMVLPETADLQRDPQHIDKITPTGPPISGTWSVGLYSGTCIRPECGLPRPLAQLPAAGLKLAKGPADGKKRTIRLTSESAKVKLRLVCENGAGWGISWLDGKMSAPLSCEPAEAVGVFWDVVVKPGKTTDIQLVVFPASTNPVAAPTEADIAKLMKKSESFGDWELSIHQPS